MGLRLEQHCHFFSITQEAPGVDAASVPTALTTAACLRSSHNMSEVNLGANLQDPRLIGGKDAAKGTGIDAAAGILKLCVIEGIEASKRSSSNFVSLKLMFFSSAMSQLFRPGP